MAWLIGAIAIYGIVVLLIGIAVMVYMLGDRQPGAAAEGDETGARARFDDPRPLARPRRDAAPGTGALGAR
jgi:hypothetical protein